VQPPLLDCCNALFAYLPPVDNWIHALKFGHDLSLARLMGLLLAERMPPPSGSARILAVPLHPRRLRQRGFNQAAEIARPLLRRGWQPGRYGCHRVRHTGAQSALTACDRQGNLRHAFGVRKRLQGDHILLIDDVMTTGATLNELAGTLKAAGADRVDAWVIARTLKVG
jgi:ComF family protein